jgi:hypothetical protein
MWRVTYHHQAWASAFMKVTVIAPFRNAPSKATKKVIAQTAAYIRKMYYGTLPAFARYEVVCPLVLFLLAAMLCRL